MTYNDPETKENQRKADVFLALVLLGSGILLFAIWPPLVLVILLLGVGLLSNPRPKD